MKHLMWLALVVGLVLPWGAVASELPSTLRSEVQPDGTSFSCSQTGDDLFQAMVDAQGFVIVQIPADSWWYYALDEYDSEPAVENYDEKWLSRPCPRKTTWHPGTKKVGMFDPASVDDETRKKNRWAFRLSEVRQKTSAAGNPPDQGSGLRDVGSSPMETP